MMFPSRSASASAFAPTPTDLLAAVFENTEVGLVVLDRSGNAVFMNSSARSFLACPTGQLPDELAENVIRIREQLTRAHQAIDRWQHADMVLRVRARKLDLHTGHSVLEVTVAKAASNRGIAEQLASALRLNITDGKLLALVWQGLSNDEIAKQLDVRVGTIKSRLFRLYQKLGVKRRPAAVLRAAEVLQGS